MTRTPWGDADDLRARRLRPGYRLPRETVERNQRSRLLGAMVAVVSERGYEATNVAHVVELSGVSRTAFYRLFANKEECFVAVVDEVVGFSGTATSAAWNKPGSWDERLRAAFDAFVGEVVAQPAAARMCLIDVFVAGPNAIEHAHRGVALFERMVGQSFEESPERAGMPPLVVSAIVGGIHQVLAARLRRGQVETLPAIAPELWEWAIAYQTPTTPLRQRRVRSGEPPISGFVARSQADRICEAMAKLTAEKGYAATKIEDVVAIAGVSLTTFYDHFATKEDAFMAAYDIGLSQAFTTAGRPYRRSDDWRDGVRAASEALLDHLAIERSWGRMGIVEALAAGPRAMERREETIAQFARLLRPGLADSGLSPVALEAVGGGVYSLVYDHIRARGPARLAELQPVTTFFSLAPFIGADAAVEIANERSQRKPRRPR
jgi:AcrR family transcriptional regulator